MVEDITLINYLFEDMICEAVENYTAIFDILPLQNLNPAVFKQYLPPGKSEAMLTRPFWKKVRSLVSQEKF